MANRIILSWENTINHHPERISWSEALVKKINEHLTIFDRATDITEFYKDYNKLPREERVRFLCELMIAICYYESQYNIESESVDVGTESDRNTWSVGLFQVSQTDIKNYGLKYNYTYKDLKEAVPNINLAMDIMANRVDKFNKFKISGKGAYWSVIKPDSTNQKINSIVVRATSNFLFWKLSNVSGGGGSSSGAGASDSWDDNGPVWLDKAKKYQGKKETDKDLQAVMVPLWMKLFKLPLKNITENWQAWCGLAVGAALMWGGMSWQKDGSLAKNWDKYGQAINWKVNGIPRGAIIRINHKADCNLESSNHVTFSDGDCAASDLLKAGATFNGYGGNQSNTWKVSTFPASHICAVRWPPERPLPNKILKSKNCTSGSNNNESTR